MKWIDAIVQAFETLGGEAPYADLYKQIEKNPPRTLTKAWQATVRREVENHSSDSENYIKGKPDLFYSKGIGTGVWGLRKAKEPHVDYTSKPASSQSVSKKLTDPSIFVVSTTDPIVAIDVKEPEPTQRASIQTTRIIRDTKIVKQLKLLYLDRCQICGEAIILRSRHYSEGHHLQPLGSDHNGPDISENIIILCPNHHVEMDYGALAIDPVTLEVIHVNKKNAYINKKINVNVIHPLAQKYLSYHYYTVFLQQELPA